METELSSLLESIKDEQSQMAISRVFDEFKLLTVGKPKMNVEESIEIREYCRKRTNIEIPNDKLAPEQLAWKHIYLLMDDEIIKIMGKEEKEKLDALKVQMNQLGLMSKDIEKLLPLGREIEELLIRQNSYLGVHFDSNRYKENEEKMSADMLAESTSNYKRIELAKEILKMVEKYKAIIITPLFDHQDKIYEALAKFSSIYRQIPFAIARHEAAVEKLEKLYGEWLILTEDLHKERLKIITGLRNLIELDAIVPQHIIKTNGDIKSNMPTGDFVEKYAPASVLIKEGLSKEKEISNKREPLALEMLVEPDTYIKLKLNETADSQEKKNQTVDSSKVKASNFGKAVLGAVLGFIAWGILAKPVFYAADFLLLMLFTSVGINSLESKKNIEATAEIFAFIVCVYCFNKIFKWITGKDLLLILKAKIQNKANKPL